MIQHKDKEIYFIDYSNIKTSEEFLRTIRKAGAYREKVKALGKKDLLILVDITASYFNVEILDELKKAGRIIKEISKKEAIVGVTGYKRVLLQIIQTFTNLHFNIFNTLEEAKNWLVSE